MDINTGVPIENMKDVADENSKDKFKAKLKVRLKWNKNGECEIKRDDSEEKVTNNEDSVRRDVDERHNVDESGNESESNEIFEKEQQLEEIHVIEEQQISEENTESARKGSKKKKHKKTKKDSAEKKSTPTKVIHACGECGKRFKSKSCYLTHSFEHTGFRPFICEECGKGFKRQVHLRDHMTIHTGQKRHMCPDCGKSFTVNSSLKIHMMTHSGEKPHMCNECGRCFTRSSDMLKHLRGHSGVKPFVCPDCGKSFARKQHMKSHMDTQHKNIKNSICTDCGKGFYRPRQLEIHMRSHTGERPFLCYLCGKGFASNSTLQEHLRIHADTQLEYKRKNTERKRKLRAKKKLEKDSTEEEMNEIMSCSEDQHTELKRNIDYARIINYVSEAIKEEDICSDHEDNGDNIGQKYFNINHGNGMCEKELPKLEARDLCVTQMQQPVNSHISESLNIEIDSVCDGNINKSFDTSIHVQNSSSTSSSFMMQDRILSFPPAQIPGTTIGFDFVKMDEMGNVCAGHTLNVNDTSINTVTGSNKDDQSFSSNTGAFLL